MGAYWFQQKRYGYGAGLPLTWQGWALLIGFLAVVGLAVGICAAFYPREAPWVSLAVLILTIPFLLICRAKTRGGWRWRWGTDPAP